MKYPESQATGNLVIRFSEPSFAEKWAKSANLAIFVFTRRQQPFYYYLKNNLRKRMNLHAFIYYSNRPLVAVLSKRLGVKWVDAYSAARTIRLLWFLNELGGVWVTQYELNALGAGLWNHTRFSLPDGVKDGYIACIETNWGDRSVKRYKITERGIKALVQAEKWAIEEYERSREKCRKVREKKGGKLYNIIPSFPEFAWTDLIS